MSHVSTAWQLALKHLHEYLQAVMIKDCLQLRRCHRINMTEWLPVVPENQKLPRAQELQSGIDGFDVGVKVKYAHPALSYPQRIA